MDVIGIDMSKDSFHAALNDETIREYKNTEAGIDLFLATTEGLGMTKGATVIGVESTGIYHLLFCVRCTAAGWQVKVINPILTAQMIAAGLRMVKTDRKDAKVIRMATLEGKGYVFCDTPEVLALKALVSERDNLVRMRADVKRYLHVHELRVKAIGVPLHDSFSGISMVLNKEIKDIERKMSAYATATQTLLRSLPGIGSTSAAFLVAYVSDIRRFASPEQLVAYVGIDPRTKQSGVSIHGNGRMTKRGSDVLRHVLYQAAFIAQRHDSVLHAYYRKKRSEGKHHIAALCAVERKLIHRIWAVWKRGTPFEKRS